LVRRARKNPPTLLRLHNLKAVAELLDLQKLDLPPSV
jgi:hypothetical protein